MSRNRRAPYCFLGAVLSCLGASAAGCGDDTAGPGDTATDAFDDGGDVPVDVEDDGAAEVEADAELDADSGADADTDADPDADADTGDGDDADGTDVPLPVDCTELEDSITLDGLLAHLTALEAIALASGGSRGPGTAGWEATRDYAREQLEAAGYAVTATPHEYPYWIEAGDHVLARISPTPQTYVFTDDVDTPGDFSIMDLSRPGDVTAPLAAVDLMLGLGNTSTSGCEPDDFLGFPAGAIALVQRGTCPYMVKALNADEAGAAGLIIFNQGDTPERAEVLRDVVLRESAPTNPDHGISIPVLVASYGVGEQLAGLLESGPVTMHMLVSTVHEIRTAETLTTATAGGDPDQVVMLGAHLDSWFDQPGINGDATGIAALLEIARAAAACDPSRKLRFVLWGVSYQQDVWGSILYLASLSDEDRARIHAYLDLEMLGASNYAVIVHDGDGSEFGVPGPPRSAELERFFVADMLLRGIPTIEDLNRRNDTWAFVINDIPTGALTTAKPGLKTAEEVATFGGTLDLEYGPCFLTDCDTVAGTNLVITETLAKSFAHAAQFFGIDGLTLPPAP